MDISPNEIILEEFNQNLNKNIDFNYNNFNKKENFDTNFSRNKKKDEDILQSLLAKNRKFTDEINFEEFENDVKSFKLQNLNMNLILEKEEDFINNVNNNNK